MSNDPVSELIEKRLALIADAVDGRPIARERFEAVEDLGEQIERRFGPAVASKIFDRSDVACLEVFDGRSPPPVATLSLDGIDLVEADVAAERAVAKFKKARAGRHNPDWHQIAVERIDAEIDRSRERELVSLVRKHDKHAMSRELEHSRLVRKQNTAEEPMRAPKKIEALARYLDALEGLVHSLQDRVKALEGGTSKAIAMNEFPAAVVQRALAESFRGPWLPGHYSAGQIVLRDGSSFIAVEDTDAKPGDKDTPWRMIAKRGRDGTR